MKAPDEVTRFTDYRDPKPRSRPVYLFTVLKHFRNGSRRGKSLRQSVFDIPASANRRTAGMPDKCHQKSGKFLPQKTAQSPDSNGNRFRKNLYCHYVYYRLLKYAKAKRVLFLVDTKNLGEQAEQEFMAYMPNDDNRKFTELYSVHRLKSGYMPTDSQVCISTIQRLYSILKVKNWMKRLRKKIPNEIKWEKRNRFRWNTMKKCP